MKSKSIDSVLMFKQSVWITQKILSAVFLSKHIDRTIYRMASNGLLAYTKETLDGQEKRNA